MPAIRFALIFAPLALIGCPADEPEPVDEAAACQAACVANGHATGTLTNGVCACSTPPVTDAGQPRDTGTSPTGDSGQVPQPTDGGVIVPGDSGPVAPPDAGYNNHDIGVIDPDAGEFPISRNLACNELCRWGFSGWRNGVDGGPGAPVECPQDREVVFGGASLEACSAACEVQTAEWNTALFSLLQDCVQTSECGERTACVPATIETNWPAPVCTDLCTGLIDYRTGAASCQPPRFGENCETGCATELNRVGALMGTTLLRCYENVVSLCINAENRDLCQCGVQANCHGRDLRLAQRLAWQYCNLRNNHCRAPNELPMNMVDCIDRRMIEVLGHRSQPELQACLRRFEANPVDCFENLDNCLTPF